MRQWLCDPEILCDEHILGEHVEHHMFTGGIRKGTSMRGFLDKNYLEPRSLKIRHDILVEEMTRRGWNHKTPLKIEEGLLEKLGSDIDHKMDHQEALRVLLSRCPICRKKYLDKYGEIPFNLDENL